jgi:hypothetical protein
MPEDKGLGSRLLGLFVEVEPQDTPGEAEGLVTPEAPGGGKSAADVVAALASASSPRTGGKVLEVPRIITPGNLPLAPSVVPPSAGAVAPAQVDFDAVFRNAGLDAAELDRVRKAEALLASLPEGASVEVKRQIVEASLRAFGFDVAKIVTAAATQARAVETWVRLNDQQTQKAVQEAKARIAQLEEQIIGLKADIDKRTQQLAGMAAAADQRRDQLKAVSDFFEGKQPNPPARPQ